MVASPESDDFIQINPISILDEPKDFTRTHDNKKFIAVYVWYSNDESQACIGIPQENAESFIIDSLKILAKNGSDKAKRALSFLED